jgi:hypothetical protein
LGIQEQVSKAFGYLRDRKLAYQLTFQTTQPANLVVLMDLVKFCRACESCVVPGDRDKTLMLEGRREVILRIQQHLNLTPEQLFALYGGDVPKFLKEETQ